MSEHIVIYSKPKGAKGPFFPEYPFNLLDYAYSTNPRGAMFADARDYLRVLVKDYPDYEFKLGPYVE